MNRRVALGLVGASLGMLRARPARAADAMRVAAPALDATALVFYANDENYFKNAGLPVDVQAMANGEAVTLAIAGGAVDVGCSEVVSLILAFHKGIPITLIAAGGEQAPKAAVGMLFARNGLAVTTGADFTGKTIAVVGLNGFAQYGTQLWIDKNGGDSKRVKFVQFAGAQIGVALQDGRVDGAFVPEPFVSAVKKVARPVANSMAAIAPQFLSSAHFTTVPYAKAHADEIRKFQSALHQAADWANAHTDQTAVILERVARVAPAVVAASVRAHFGDTLEASSVQPLIDMAAKYGNFPSFSANDLIYRA
ncbi:MAG TPA: ABC transporter substrate-binding protein [Candidatus Lustribacter sp.]